MVTDRLVISSSGTTIKKVQPHYIREFWYRNGINGDATAGTITILVKGPGSDNFETPSSSTIDIAAPQRLEVTGTIIEVEFTVSGFTGSASELELSTTGHTP